MAGKGRPGPAPGDPRMVEAGRRGGQAVLEKYGPDFFAAIGQMGGVETKKARGKSHFSRIGKLGGEATATRKRGLADG